MKDGPPQKVESAWQPRSNRSQKRSYYESRLDVKRAEILTDKYRYG